MGTLVHHSEVKHGKIADGDEVGGHERKRRLEPSDKETFKGWMQGHVHAHKRHKTHATHAAHAKPAVEDEPASRPKQAAAATRVQPSAGLPSGDVGIAFQRINAHRAAQGLPALKWNPDAARVAQGQANRQAQADSMFHSKSFFDELSAHGAHYANENVAYGYKTGDAVFNGWKYSPGHNANMLSPKITSVGLAVAYSGDGTPYWTMNGMG